MTEAAEQLECGKCHYKGPLPTFGLDKPPGDYATLYVCPRCHKRFLFLPLDRLTT
jgi:ribosomal protein S27AE